MEELDIYIRTELSPDVLGLAVKDTDGIEGVSISEGPKPALVPSLLPGTETAPRGKHYNIHIIGETLHDALGAVGALRTCWKRKEIDIIYMSPATAYR
jgi:hypothetical protein